MKQGCGKIIAAVLVAAAWQAPTAHAFGLDTFNQVKGLVDAVNEVTGTAAAVNDVEAASHFAETNGILKSRKVIYFAQAGDYFTKEQMHQIVASVNGQIEQLNDHIDHSDDRLREKAEELRTRAVFKVAGPEVEPQAGEAMVLLYNRGSHGFIDAVSRLAGQHHYNFKITADGTVLADAKLDLHDDIAESVDLVVDRLLMLVIQNPKALN